MKIITESQALELLTSQSSEVLLVGTHDGVFQADDAFAIACLSLEFGGITVVRTRDADILDGCQIVVDVGGVYDPVLKRFDHHQRGGAGSRTNSTGHTVPYSSFGLVWKHVGPMMMTEILLDHLENGSMLAIDDPRVVEACRLVDELIVQGIDGIDCGVSPVIGGNAVYHPVGVSGALASINPTWVEAKQSAENGRTVEQLFNDCFLLATSIASTFLSSAIESVIADLMAESEVRRVIESAGGAPLLVFHNGGLPWSRAVLESAPNALYVVFPDVTGHTAMLQCVPTHLGSFDKRKALPAAWAGLRGAELAEVTGVPDAVFCHPGRFICGARTMSGALHLARMAIDADE